MRFAILLPAIVVLVWPRAVADETIPLDALVRELGAPSWADRHSAESRLLDAGPPAERLTREAIPSPDPEVSMRARRIARLLRWSDAFTATDAAAIGAVRIEVLEAIADGRGLVIPGAECARPYPPAPAMRLVVRVLRMGPPAPRIAVLGSLLACHAAIRHEDRESIGAALDADRSHAFRRILLEGIVRDLPRRGTIRIHEALEDLRHGTRADFALEALRAIDPAIAVPRVLAELYRLDLFDAGDRADALVLEDVLATWHPRRGRPFRNARSREAQDALEWRRIREGWVDVYP